MCAPCKVIINEENQNSSCLSTLLAGLIMNPPAPMKPGSSADEALFGMAAREVENILATRREVLERLESMDVPERWLRLVKRIYGEN